MTPKILNGVKMGEGDGTVSLLSLGAMCVEGWKRKRWNPAGMKVVTVEVCPLLCADLRGSLIVDCSYRTTRCPPSLAGAARPQTTSTSWATQP